MENYEHLLSYLSIILLGSKKTFIELVKLDTENVIGVFILDKFCSECKITINLR